VSPRIYFDHSATTPLDPRVLAAMGPHLAERFGNPSSLYQEGREARQAVERARGQVADLLGADPAEIVFTASGTEADNLALLGAVSAAGGGGHVIVSAIEHPAILETVKHLEKTGVAVSLLPVDREGVAEVAALGALLRPDTRLVSVMAANNVTGVLQPVAELSRLTGAHGAIFHTDAVQAAGKIPLEVRCLPVDLLSLSAHKLHGPKGVGALYVRKGTRLSPIVHGGGQERGLRSATENVAGIVGFGEAAALAKRDLVDEVARLVTLREHLWEGVKALVPNAYLAGHPFRRLPGHLCLGFSGQENEAIKLLLALDEAGVAVSSGSACSASHAGQPSHVLQAMGFDPIRARGSLRVTLGRFSTKDEVDHFLDILPGAVASLRPAASHAGFGAPR
jgi:cysteine desulfurase